MRYWPILLAPLLLLVADIVVFATLGMPRRRHRTLTIVVGALAVVGLIIAAISS